MSIKASAAVWLMKLPAHEKYMGLALADHAHDDGSSIRPSIGFLARKTGYTARRVRQLLRALERRGPLKKVAERPGSSTVYRLDLTWGGGEIISPVTEKAGRKFPAQGGGNFLQGRGGNYFPQNQKLLNRLRTVKATPPFPPSSAKRGARLTKRASKALVGSPAYYGPDYKPTTLEEVLSWHSNGKKGGETP